MANGVQDNPALSRFELKTSDGTAFAAYERDGDRVVLTHTEVPQAMTGQGIGSKLVRGTLDRLRVEGVRVVPRCPFVAAFIEHHPEYRDLVAAA